MPGQDYTFRFVSELVGSQNIADLAGYIGKAAEQAKVAKESTDAWAKAIEVTAKNSGISVKELTAVIQRHAAEEKKASDEVVRAQQAMQKAHADRAKAWAREDQERERANQRAVKDAQDRADADERAAARAMAAEDRLNRFRIQLLRNTEALQLREARAAAKAAAAASGSSGTRGAILSFLGDQGDGGGSSGGGGGAGGAGGRASLLGRIGGRIFGAEVGSNLGVPGGGFIGSQAAQSLGISGGAAAGLGFAAAGAYGLVELAKHVGETAKWAQEQRNLGKEFGISAGEMATFSLAAETTGVNVQGAIKSVSGLSEELLKGGPKYKEVSVALSELGLKPETAFKPTSDGIKDIVSALSKIPDETDRSRKAVELLGESGRSLAALVGNMPDLQDKLNVSDDAVNRVARLRDILAEIDSSAKGGFLDALAFVLQGVLPDRSFNPAKGKLALPNNIQAKPLDTTYGIQIGNGAFGELRTPAQITAERVAYSQSYQEKHGTPEDKYQSTLASIDIDKKKAERGFKQDFTLDQAGYNRAMEGISARKATALATKQAEEEAIRKRKEYEKLISEPVRSYKEGNDLLLKLNKEFPGFPVPPQLYGSAVAYASAEAGKVGESEYLKTPSLYSLIGKEAGAEKFRVIRPEEPTPQQRESDRIQNDITGLRAGVLHNATAEAIAQSGYTTALASGQSRYGMTQAQISRLELSQSLAAIAAQTGPQVAGLRGRAALLTQSAGATGISDEQRFKYQQESHDALIEADNKELEARTKSVDAINKFNDSIDKATEAMKHEFAGGFESILMGAQTGALHGQAGAGALGALRNFGTRTEGTILNNVGGLIFDNIKDKFTRPGSDSTLGKVLSGTIFGPLDAKKDPVAAAAVVVSNATINANRIIAAINGLRGGGGGGGTGEGGDYNSPEGGVFGGAGGAAGAAGDVASVATGAGAVASAIRSGSSSGIVSALTNSFGKAGAALASGMKLAGNWDAITGNLGNPGANGQAGTEESRTQQAGAIIGTAALGLAATEGILTMSKGGARNITGGLAGTLAAIGPLTGPAAPFVEAGAAALGLVSSFLPDPKTQRANQISKAIFTQQYLAPPSQNITESGNGAYSDLDIYGGVRTSHFSPYPITTDPYLDVPRRTVVPGGTLATFGGAGGPVPGSGAQRPSVPTPVTIHVNVNAMDSKSFNDNSGKIADAVHLALVNGHQPMVHTLRGQLGL